MSRVFNGISPDSIILPPSASLDTLLPSFTLMAWIYPSTDSSSFYKVFMGVGSNGFKNTEFQAVINVPGSGTGPDWSITSIATNGARASTLGNVIAPNTWYHVAITYDGAGSKIPSIYINGVLSNDAAQNNPGGSPLSGLVGGQAVLGCLISFGAPDLLFKGNMAEVQIYNAILTPVQIISAMNAVVPLPANLVAYLHLCGSLSPELDVSGNNNAGTVTGTTQGPDSPAFTCRVIAWLGGHRRFVNKR